jgi:hypothetical protein
MAISNSVVDQIQGDNSIHPSFCNCAMCIQQRSKFSTEKKDTIKKNDHEIEISDYTSESIYSKHQKRIEDLVKAHWAYQEQLLTAGQDKSQTFTWDQVMEMRKWDYCSSAKHFYGHGYEDAIEYIE